MRVALLPPVFTGRLNEATQITTINLAKELQDQHVDVTIISEGRNDLPAKEVYAGVPVFRLYNFPRFRSWWTSRMLSLFLCHPLTIRKLCKKKKKSFDILHSFSSAPILMIRALLSHLFCRNAKIVHTMKSYSLSSFGRLFTRLLKFADMVTVQTHPMKKHLVKAGIPAYNIRVVRSHIDLKRFQPGNKVRLKKELGFAGKKLVLYYGALRKEKGVDALIAAARRVQTKNCYFLFLSRRYHTYYDEMIKGLPARIDTSDVPIEKYVAAADVVVLAYPTLIGTEGNPSCLLEAMACKTPVITTSLPEIQDIVRADEVVFVPPEENIHILAKEIDTVLARPSQTKISKAYKKAHAFSTQKAAQHFLDIYKAVRS